MIPYAEFRRLLMDATECSTMEDYIAEVGGSVSMNGVSSVVNTLAAIWTMGHTGVSIKSISAACDISSRQIALRYKLPTRTVENWAAGERTPPEWQLPLIGYAVLSDYIGELI